jgi:hypothetical protein
MAESTYFPEVRCEVLVGGIFPNGVTARISDTEGCSQFVQLTRGMINRRGNVDYLPVGFVEIDRGNRRVLIELPAEADSGANRMWVEFDDLRMEDEPGAGAVA